MTGVIFAVVMQLCGFEIEHSEQCRANTAIRRLHPPDAALISPVKPLTVVITPNHHESSNGSNAALQVPFELCGELASSIFNY